jgi:hypothetical protein
MNRYQRLALAAVAFGGLAFASIGHAASTSVPPVIQVTATHSGSQVTVSITSNTGTGIIDINQIKLRNIASSQYIGSPLAGGSSGFQIVSGSFGPQIFNIGELPVGCYAVYVKTNASGNWSTVSVLSNTFGGGDCSGSSSCEEEEPTLTGTVTQKTGAPETTTLANLETTTINIAPSMFPLTFSFTAEDNVTVNPTVEISEPTQVEGKDADSDYDAASTTNSITFFNSGGIGNVIQFEVNAEDDCENIATHTYIINVVRGDQGLGNGVDANTPGNIPSGENDAGGTPGSPGAKLKPKK